MWRHLSDSDAEREQVAGAHTMPKRLPGELIA